MAILKPKVSIYKVRKGDCLWNIAKSQYGDPTLWSEISKANSLSNPHLILVGQILQLPTIQSHHPVPGSQPLTNGTTTQSSKPNSVAKSVRYPAFSYKFDSPPVKIVFDKHFYCEIKLTGKITLQKRGTIDNFKMDIEFSKVGGQAKFQADADMAYWNFYSTIATQFGKSGTPTPEFSSGIAAKVKVNEKVISTNKYEITSSGCLKFTSESCVIEGKFGDFYYKCVFGYEVKACFSTSTNGRGRVVFVFDSKKHSKWVALGDVPKNSGTLAEDISPDISNNTISYTEAAMHNIPEAEWIERLPKTPRKLPNIPKKLPKIPKVPMGGLLGGKPR